MKKSIVVMFALLISTAAFASINKNSSWEQIFKSHDYMPRFPNFGLAMSVTHYCVDGEMLRADRLKEVCVEWEMNERGDCIRTELVNADSPLTKSRTVCVEFGHSEGGDCLRYENQTYRIPLTFNVEVYNMKNAHSEAGDYDLAFIKEYTIPACR